MNRKILTLNDQQKQELEHLRDHSPKPYIREKAAALLKVAHDHSPHWVAKNGLLKPREPDTIYHWIEIYQTKGLDGLYIQGNHKRKIPP